MKEGVTHLYTTRQSLKHAIILGQQQRKMLRPQVLQARSCLTFSAVTPYRQRAAKGVPPSMGD